MSPVMAILAPQEPQEPAALAAPEGSGPDD